MVVAAGLGTRLASAAAPKALVEVAGRSLVAHTLARLRAGVAEVVVVAPCGHEAAVARACAPFDPTRVVAGGGRRSDSVRAGVAAVTGADVIAIHDAARPFTPHAVLTAAVKAIAGSRSAAGKDERAAQPHDVPAATAGPVLAAAPTVPVADTIKRVEAGRVLGTVDRHGLHAVQTPQVFPRPILDRVLAWAGDLAATDELGLVEQARDAGVVSGDIVAVPGSPLAFKVTYPADLDLAAVAAAGPLDG